ncbi:MAG TPA: CBS domain-containing protein [Methanoregulaceae archaeon]|nr:CBS domain-containing protein [Methanoregulaceae archaeon]HQJ87647.1 CBS domain-containing protein [Methanoregulaceae archaeon]
MDLSLIQKDILVTLITLYHRHSQPVKGEDIAEVIHRNPGTIRNQMQALKTLELVDGVPGPKGGYNPTMKAYQELNISQSGQEVQVPIARNGVLLPEISATEVDLTTLCHPDVCHAVVRIMGSVRQFQNGDEITVGPTPVNKLLIRGEIFGKDERNGALMISISEMISLPKKPVRAYMSHPLHVVPATATLEDAVRLFAGAQINGAPVMDGTTMQGIVTVTDVVRALAAGRDLSTRVTEVMTGDVVQVDGDVRLYEVVKRFKEREIGRLIVVEDGRPVGILTKTDIIRVFPPT